jgi:hypothetical protein
MKVLLLGNPSSVWVKEFVQHVMLPLGAQVFLQESYGGRPTYYDYYSKAGVRIIPFMPIQKWIMFLPKIRGLVMSNRQREAASKYAPFDVIINMFVSPESLSQAVSNRHEGTRIYAYFCGSDILRSSRLNSLRLKSSLKNCNCIVFASSSVQAAYFQKFGNTGGTSFETIRLGMSGFDYIDSRLSSSSKHDCKSSWGIDPNKLTVCIGYNASKAQNHLPVLRPLKHLSKSELSKITILLPLTYGGNQAYIANVARAASEVGCEFRLFRTYMDMSQIAQLRLSTDVFINAQATDGLSGSVLEALYAGATLLNASWLQYKEYGEWGILYKRFFSYAQIPQLLAESMGDTSGVAKNSKSLSGQMSWQQCRGAWARLLKRNIRG